MGSGASAASACLAREVFAHAIRCFLCAEDEQVIPGVYELVTPRHDRLLAAEDGGDDCVLPGAHLLERPRHERRLDGQLEHAGLAVLDDRQQAGRAAGNLVENRDHCRAPRRDRHVDADALEEPQVGGPPDAGDDFGHAQLAAEQRGQQVPPPILVVSEGAVPKEGGAMTLVSGDLDAFGHVRLGGIGDRIAKEIEQRTGAEARAVVLGHIQRGGTPTAFDRWLATRFGLQAIDAVAEGDFGTMMALRGTKIIRVPLVEGTGELKTVSPEEYAEAEVFFG